jgi:hypothetical protein
MLSNSRNKYFDCTCDLHPIDQARGHFGVHQVIGEAERDAQDQQDAADDGGAFDEDFAIVARELEVAIDEDFDEEGAERGEGRGFGQCAEATNRAHDHDGRQRELPLGAPHAPRRFAQRERLAHRAALDAHADADEGDGEIMSSSGRIAPVNRRSRGVCE